MTSEKNEIQSKVAELRDEIVALDAELAEDFRAQFSVAPFLSRKIVSFQGNKGKPAYSWYKYKEAFSAGLLSISLGVMLGGCRERCSTRLRG